MTDKKTEFDILTAEEALAIAIDAERQESEKACIAAEKLFDRTVRTISERIRDLALEGRISLALHDYTRLRDSHILFGRVRSCTDVWDQVKKVFIAKGYAIEEVYNEGLYVYTRVYWGE